MPPNGPEAPIGSALHKTVLSELRPHRTLPPNSGGATFRRPVPIIANIRLDKTEVCRGEENFVHVDVDTVDDTDSDLRVWLVGGAFLGSQPTGRRMPLRLFAPLDREAPPLIMVTGRGANHTQSPLPYIKVKDCDAGPFLELVVTRTDGQGPDVFEMRANLKGRPIPDVTWSFGDGATTTSHAPAVLHGYGNRLQRSAYSDFLVAATATDSRGRVMHGYRTVELVNRDYWAHQRGS